MSPTTRRRYEVYDQVEHGGATIGLIRERYGFMGLRTIARQLRFGRFKISGIAADTLPRLNPQADIALAEKLEQMSSMTGISQIIAPPRECQN